MSELTTPHLQLPILMPSQAQKHVTHNEALEILDCLVQLSVLSSTLSVPPAAADGARHIVGTGATGDWAGHDREVATAHDGAWRFFSPRDGWIAWVADTHGLVVWSAATAEWRSFAVMADLVSPISAADGTLKRLGVQAAADTVNRLSVKSDAVLFSHDDVTPGTGHQRVFVNKQAAGKEAALVFQTGYSARSVIGLSGDDDLAFKVSADGTLFQTGLVLRKETGAAYLPRSAKFLVRPTTEADVPAGIWRKVAFATILHNDLAAFSATTNGFVAPVDGCYHFDFGLVYASAGATPTQMYGAFYVNNAVVESTTTAVVASAGLTAAASSVTAGVALKLVAGDLVDVRIYFSAGIGRASAARSRFSGHYVP